MESWDNGDIERSQGRPRITGMEGVEMDKNISMNFEAMGWKYETRLTAFNVHCWCTSYQHLLFGLWTFGALLHCTILTHDFKTKFPPALPSIDASTSFRTYHFAKFTNFWHFKHCGYSCANNYFPREHPYDNGCISQFFLFNKRTRINKTFVFTIFISHVPPFIHIMKGIDQLRKC